MGAIPYVNLAHNGETLTQARQDLSKPGEGNTVGSFTNKNDNITIHLLLYGSSTNKSEG